MPKPVYLLTKSGLITITTLDAITQLKNENLTVIFQSGSKDIVPPDMFAWIAKQILPSDIPFKITSLKNVDIPDGEAVLLKPKQVNASSGDKPSASYEWRTTSELTTKPHPISARKAVITLLESNCSASALDVAMSKLMPPRMGDILVEARQWALSYKSNDARHPPTIATRPTLVLSVDKKLRRINPAAFLARLKSYRQDVEYFRQGLETVRKNYTAEQEAVPMPPPPPIRTPPVAVAAAS